LGVFYWEGVELIQRIHLALNVLFGFYHAVPKRSEGLLKDLPRQKRAIWVLHASGAFTFSEMEGLSIKLEERQIRRIYKQVVEALGAA